MDTALDINTIALTPIQLDMLKSMIGINKYPKIINNTYTAYRNRYCSHSPIDDLEKLCELGICSRQECAGAYFYFVTAAGAELIGAYLSIKVVLDDD